MGSRGIWSLTSAGTRRGLVVVWTTLFLGSLLLQYTSFSRPSAALAADGLKAGTVQGFEVDGDLASGNGASNPGSIPATLIDVLVDGDDWMDGASGNGVVDPASPPSSALFEDLISSTSDDGYGGGAKETDTRTWSYALHKSTPKDDIHWAMAYAKFVGASAFFYAGASRIVNNGTTHIDFELNRLPFKTYSDGISKPNRSIGDVLISLEFSNGGSDPIVTVYKVTGITGYPTGQDTTFSLDIASAAAVHSATNFVALADQGIGPIPEFQFAETSIDLAALGINTGCPGLSNGHIRTRAGGDLDSSQLKDDIPPFPIDLNNCGKITIVKDAVPNDAQDFAFTTTGAGLAAFSLDDDGGAAGASATLATTKVFSDVAPGAYSITESAVAGWDLTGLTCNDANGSTNLGTRTASLNVGPNEEITCTFTNTKLGSITIIKDAIPNDAQDFAFTTTGSGLSSFSLDDDGDGTLSNTKVFTNVVPGAYSVTETAVTGWDLTDLVCSAGGTRSSATANIVLAAGGSVTCTFTNTKRGTIIVEKQTSPDGAEGDFTFTGTAAGTISDGEEIIVGDLVPGTYTSTEGDPTPGFDLGEIVCDESTSATPSTGNVGTRTATFKLDPGETVRCRFTNVQRGTITIIKNAVPNDAQNFSFSATGAGLSGFSLDDDNDGTLSDTKTFTNVVGGSYSVTEAAVAGWDLTGLSCNGAGGSSGAQDGTDPARANITMVAGGSVTCTFTNTKRGSITIVKDARPNDAQDFGFSTTGSGLSSFSLDDDADGTLSNTKVFGSLVPGTYSVTEAGVAGWDLTNLSCDDSDQGTTTSGATATIDLDPGQNITCTFENSKPSIQIVKTAGTAVDGAVFVTNPGNVTYTYKVKNTGPIALTGVTVRDDNGTAANLADDFSAVCPKATLAAGEEMTCTATVAVSSSRTNVATASGTSEKGTNVADSDDAVVRMPGLTILKSFVGNTGGTTPGGDPEAKNGDVLTYTLAYDLTNGPVTNGVITDTLPVGLAYVAGTATNNAEFTFDSFDAATRTLTWKAPTVTADGTVTYQALVQAGADELPQPLVNVAAIDSAETVKDDDDALVFVEPPPLAATGTPRVTTPPTDAINGQSGQSDPGFGLPLTLLALAGLVLGLGFLTPVPARVRRSDRRR